MRETKTSIAQTILNKINSKENFTYIFETNETYINNFVVSDEIPLFIGKNPSLDFKLLKKITDIIESKNYDSIGGWLDNETGLYHVDSNTHYYYLKTAKLAGYVNKQKAIFDLNTKKVIYLNN